MKQRITMLLIVFVWVASFSQSVWGCTTAIVSGKFTVDGRPLLFKQRDTPDLENKLMTFSDGKYPYIGLVNTKDTLGKAVFGGFNEFRIVQPEPE